MRHVAWFIILIFSAACVEQPTTVTTTKRPSGKTLKVGVLLPLSGRYKLYGESTLHGAECGAGKIAPCRASVPVELIAKDSGSDPDQAAAAVTELAQQDKVAGIVGPLLSRTADGAARRAEELHVPLISLSQRDGVAEIGDYVFRTAINTASQVATLADYAVKERGWKRIAIVYPNSPYGQSVRNAFREQIIALGGEVVAEKSYGAEIANIVEARHEGGPEDEAKPVKPRPKPGSLSTSGEIVAPSAAAEEKPTPVIPKVRGADAVFIPDSYRNVLAMFKFGGPDIFGGAPLLGINRWNSPHLLDGGAQVEGAVFVDAFYRHSGDNNTQEFVRNFAEAYQMDPTVLEAFAYDAVRILIRAAQEARSREPDRIRAALAKVKNFPGVTGRTSFNNDGDAVKQLHLLTVRDGTIQELSAPRRASNQSAIGRAIQRRPAAPFSPKYDQGGTPSSVPAEPLAPIHTERGKYDPEASDLQP